jgi:hypothetical protein
MTPIYRAVVAAILDESGVLDPVVRADGTFHDSQGDLLHSADGPALIVQALALADAAVNSRLGREVVEALAKDLGIDALEAKYDALGSEGHILSDDWAADTLIRAARFVASQPGA